MFGLPAKLSHGVLQLRFVESKFFPMTITGLGFKQDLIDSSPTGGRRGGGGNSHILAIRVRAAGKGMVFKPFSLVQGLVIIEIWSSIGSRLTGSLTKD